MIKPKCVLCLLPAVYIVLIAVALLAFRDVIGDAVARNAVWWRLISVVHAVVGALALIAIVVLSIHAVKNGRLHWWQRMLWLFGLWTLGAIVAPVYCFRYVDHGTPPEEAADARSQRGAGHSGTREAQN